MENIGLARSVRGVRERFHNQSPLGQGSRGRLGVKVEVPLPARHVRCTLDCVEKLENRGAPKISKRSAGDFSRCNSKSMRAPAIVAMMWSLTFAARETHQRFAEIRSSRKTLNARTFSTLSPQERTSPGPGRSSFYRSCLKPSLSRSALKMPWPAPEPVRS